MFLHKTDQKNAIFYGELAEKDIYKLTWVH